MIKSPNCHKLFFVSNLESYIKNLINITVIQWGLVLASWQVFLPHDFHALIGIIFRW